MNRKYLPSYAELIDRLSINQIKEVKIPEHKEAYAQEIKDILHDINVINSEIEVNRSLFKSPDCHGVNPLLLRAIVVLAQINLHIWVNESKVRAGDKDGNLHLTHGLNGIRNQAKNIIQDLVAGGERKDFKVDCLASQFSDWEISWTGFNEDLIKILTKEDMKNLDCPYPREEGYEEES